MLKIKISLLLVSKIINFTKQNTTKMKKLFFVLITVTVGFTACKKSQTLAPTAPEASFITNVTIGHNPSEKDIIQLTNTSTDNSTYLWDFGNGTTSTEKNPTTTYFVHGNYPIKLSVTNSEGLTTTITQTITILCRFKNGDHTSVEIL